MSKTNRELFVDSLGPIITAIGLIVTVILFNREQRLINEREIESRVQQEILYSKRTQWEKQQQVYADLSEVVGKLSAELYSQKSFDDTTFKDFYQLFFGSIVLVEDENVREAMNLLHLDIKKLREKKRSVLIKEDPIVVVIRASNHLIETLKTSSEKYRNEIREFQNELNDESN